MSKFTSMTGNIHFNMNIGGNQPRPQGLPRGGARAEEDPGKIR